MWSLSLSWLLTCVASPIERDNQSRYEPGPEATDLGWPAEAGPEARPDHLPPSSPAHRTSPGGSAAPSGTPKILKRNPPPPKKESATPVLERVLLTASKWEQAVGGWGESRRGEEGGGGGELHRDFFFLSPVTSCQFTPQRIRNQNLIKILNK